MHNPTPTPNTTQKVIYLDYLRIFACLGVFACHLWAGSLLYIHNEVSTLNLQLPPSECLGMHGDGLYKCGFNALFVLPNDNWKNFLFNCFNVIFGAGYQGVHLFFILSGFGLTFSGLLKKNIRIKWIEFLKKRFLRLYPSYWIVLAIFLAIESFHYKNPLGALKTYFLGSIFLNVIPATWFIPIILQLYLLFPLLFYFLNKLSIRKFLIWSLIVKAISSAIIIVASEFLYGKILGFGDGALAPGGIALTRLFEFCFGMALAKIFISQGCSLNIFRWFRQAKIIMLGFFLEIAGLFLSMKFVGLDFNSHIIPFGLFVSDALIGVGIFILCLNFAFLIHIIVRTVKTAWIDKISSSTYEAYLIHGCLLGYFENLLFMPILKSLNSQNSYLITCFLYLIILFVFSFSNLFLGYYLLKLKSYLVKTYASMKLSRG
ncbi:MAG: acyltransferase [Chroococcidiopsidaceae cyanobacterium CP_BM_RX_35]|nr:acyltransferase [Chroococcidiopsidaceae cyanobacterium CP_BM_RX_35]